ncbi:hypothetical protein N431DRAFT_82966 [Stipitochalara longipes BDJ]|nr:hypothetical protein N431DRAFT_82966 [Stipitochalara longipes BDJ]
MGSKTKKKLAKKLAKKQSSEAEDKKFREAETKQFNETETSWCPEFSTVSSIHDTLRRVDVRKDLETVGGDLEIFFAASGNVDSRFELENLSDFCRGHSLADVIAAKGPGGLQRIAWMDDRISGPGLEGGNVAREYKNPLTATGLFRALDKLRFDHEHLSDAARRLVYVTDLSPACIHALVGTASGLQAKALREAISKHLAFQSSIAVKIASAGIRTFQLDLHLPFFKLDRSRPPNGSPQKVNAKPRRRWTDLSFMKLETCELQGEDQDPKEVWGVQEAHISCVVAGTDNWRWIGYGFVDTEIDGFLADKDPAQLEMDQIAAELLHTTPPLLCAREYWIKIFEIRIACVREHWLYLIGKLERSIDLYASDRNAFPYIIFRLWNCTGASRTGEGGF